MKRIRNWTAVQRYGITLLTGEACTLMIRGLFDVNGRGKAILQRFFSANDWTMTLKLPENWNGSSGTTEDPSINSIMLPYDLLRPLSIFLMTTEERLTVKYIVSHPTSGTYGLETEEEILAVTDRNENVMRLMFDFPIGELTSCRLMWNPMHPALLDGDHATVSGRNVHQMTGRAV